MDRDGAAVPPCGQPVLWELPAGKLEPGEDPLAGAKRELAEETGYRAKKWKPLVEYYASPGFLGESMKVFLAEGLMAGDAHPEEDEQIEFRLVKLSDVLKMIEKGAILDGKTLTSVLLYARLQTAERGRNSVDGSARCPQIEHARRSAGLGDSARPVSLCEHFVIAKVQSTFRAISAS